MLDLVNKILRDDTAVNTASHGNISAMIRPQTEGLPAIVFGLLDTKFENVTTMGSTTAGTTRSAGDIYSIGIACLDSSLSDAFDLHTKTRTAFEGFDPADVTIGSNSYRVHSIHLKDIAASVDEEGEIYVYEGIFEIALSIL